MREPYNRESRPARVEQQHQVTQIVATNKTNNTSTSRFDEFPIVSLLHTSAGPYIVYTWYLSTIFI